MTEPKPNDAPLVFAAAAYLNAALDALRPYTGRLEVQSADIDRSVLEKALVGRTGYTLSGEQESLLVLRTEPPEGAADWTHEMGGAGNEFANTDQLVKWPLGVLWFSGEIDRYFSGWILLLKLANALESSGRTERVKRHCCGPLWAIWNPRTEP